VCDADDVVPLPVFDQAKALKRLHNIVCRQHAGRGGGAAGVRRRQAES
jgi:hypothetical protein